MALFRHLTPQELEEEGLIYEGYFARVVPIYLGNLDEEAPLIAARNWVPEWVLDVVSLLCQLSVPLIELTGGQAGGFPLRVTARLDGKPLSEDPALTKSKGWTES